MRSLLVAGILLFCSVSSYGQSKFPSDYLNDISPSMPVAEVGTYQFIIHDEKYSPVFTTEMLQYAEFVRSEEVDLTFEISKNVYLHIPSKKTIQSDKFIPLSEISK